MLNGDSTLCNYSHKSDTHRSNNCVESQQSVVGVAAHGKDGDSGVVKITCNDKKINKDIFSYHTVSNRNTSALKCCPHEIKIASKPVGVMFESNPHQQFIKENSSLTKDSSATDYFRVVSKITASGLPNYKGEKVPLASNFNISLWRNKLDDCHDQHIVNLLKFGFSLGIQSREKL